jgi:hypothetical protein
MARTRRNTDASTEGIRDDGPMVLTSEGGSSGSMDERIAHRAYQRYEERGREDGRDLDDWLEAEREVRNRGHE